MTGNTMITSLSKQEMEERMNSAVDGISALDALLISINIALNIIRTSPDENVKKSLLNIIIRELENEVYGKKAEDNMVGVYCTLCNKEKIKVHKNKIEYVNICDKCMGVQ